MNDARRICMIRQHYINLALINGERFPRFGIDWQNGGVWGGPSVKGTNRVILCINKIWTFVSAVDNEINLAPQVNIDRREGFHKWGNFNSYHIKYLREVNQIQYNVAIARAFTFESQRWCILIKSRFNDLWMWYDHAYFQSFNLFCKSVRMFILEMQRQS